MPKVSSSSSGGSSKSKNSLSLSSSTQTSSLEDHVEKHEEKRFVPEDEGVLLAETELERLSSLPGAEIQDGSRFAPLFYSPRLNVISVKTSPNSVFGPIKNGAQEFVAHVQIVNGPSSNVPILHLGIGELFIKVPNDTSFRVAPLTTFGWKNVSTRDVKILVTFFSSVPKPV